MTTDMFRRTSAEFLGISVDNVNLCHAILDAALFISLYHFWTWNNIWPAFCGQLQVISLLVHSGFVRAMDASKLVQSVRGLRIIRVLVLVEMNLVRRRSASGAMVLANLCTEFGGPYRTLDKMPPPTCVWMTCTIFQRHSLPQSYSYFAWGYPRGFESACGVIPIETSQAPPCFQSQNNFETRLTNRLALRSLFCPLRPFRPPTSFSLLNNALALSTPIVPWVRSDNSGFYSRSLSAAVPEFSNTKWRLLRIFRYMV